MKEYPKIDGIFLREDERPHNLIWGVYRNDLHKDLEKLEWCFTEKIDGTNIRVHWDGHKVTFGGRTDAAQIPAHLFTKLNDLFGGSTNEQVFEQKFGETEVTFYGEGYGAKIQKGGGLYNSEPNFIMFDARVGNVWLQRDSLEDLAKSFDIKVVPIAFRGTLDDAIAFAKVGFNSLIAEQERPSEGMVGTPTCGVLDRMGKRVIVKLKTHDLQPKGKSE